jgi:hypothetical protein
MAKSMATMIPNDKTPAMKTGIFISRKSEADSLTAPFVSSRYLVVYLYRDRPIILKEMKDMA